MDVESNGVLLRDFGVAESIMKHRFYSLQPLSPNGEVLFSRRRVGEGLLPHFVRRVFPHSVSVATPKSLWEVGVCISSVKINSSGPLTKRSPLNRLAKPIQCNLDEVSRYSVQMSQAPLSLN
jgi:hypothetical protein